MENTVSFAQGLNLYKLFWIFAFGCFLGVVIETLWCIFRYHKLESRKGLVWGPFNLVYGFGALAMTLGLYPIRDCRDLLIFAAGSVIGGVFEYLCSVVQEKLTGTVSWDYRDFPLNLHGRINLLYCFFWGILALLWVKDLFPNMTSLIEKIPSSVGVPLTWLGILFFVIDSILSALVVYRMNARCSGSAKTSRYWKMIDSRYPDEKVKRIYPNMQFGVHRKAKHEEEKIPCT
ncbi:MAG: putative ABC transporter permease [Clostridia bacterium]|nr:putative ABC transporter permease [Clostridia bacterium]